MRKKLILHIGAEKTATTYIQEILFLNRNYLYSQGVLYPEIGFDKTAQFSLIAALHELDNDRPLEFAPDASFTIESEWIPFLAMCNSLQNNINTVLLSAEHFSSRLRDNGLRVLRELTEKLINFDIEIIYYFRNQIDFFESWYSTYIKAGGTDSCHEAFARLKKNRWFFDYHFVLQKWKEYLPKAEFTVKYYDDIKADDGVKEDFFIGVLGLKDISVLKSPDKQINLSWSAKALAFSRMANVCCREHLLVRRYEILNKINEYGLLKQDFDSYMLNKDQCNQLQQLYGESNDKLIRNFCKYQPKIRPNMRDFEGVCIDDIYFDSNHLVHMIMDIFDIKDDD